MELNENEILVKCREQCEDTDEKNLNEEPLTSSLIEERYEKAYEGFPLCDMDRLRQKRSKSPILPLQKIEQSINTKQRISTFESCNEIIPQRNSRGLKINNSMEAILLKENSTLQRQLRKKDEEILQLRLELAKQIQINFPINNELSDTKQYKCTPITKGKSKTLNVNRSSQLMKKLSFKRNTIPRDISPTYQFNREEREDFELDDEQYNLENGNKEKEFWGRQKLKAILILGKG